MDVSTRYGTVSGVTAGGVTRFLGIPYAAAPFGDNRFGPPVPPEHWTGVRAADAFGPTAPKVPVPGELGALITDPVVPGAECLNLNVWTPGADGPPRPVLVWLHGGAFTNGSSAVTGYDGATFARAGVVCVTLNYRLGMEGFGYVPGAPAPANRGLLDQLRALEWVRDNIAAFGGDPGDVTLSGESAGAMCALTLLATGSDLFHRVAVASGSAELGQAVPDALRVTAAVAEQLGVTPDFAGLASSTPEALAAAQAAVGAVVGGTADAARFGRSTIAACGLAYVPVVDGAVLPCRPIEALRAGAGAAKPLLIGTTTEEYRLFLIASPLVQLTDPAPLRARVEAYGAPPGSYDDYAAGGSPAYPRVRPAETAAALLTDRMFRIPSYRVAEARAGLPPATTHVFEFGRRSPVTPNPVGAPLGACHGSELPFLWDVLALPDSRSFVGPDAPQPLADQLHGRWLEFATTGRLADWPPYTPADRTVLVFAHDDGPGTVLVEDPRGAERQLWGGGGGHGVVNNRG
ncbi:carboxylesterase family protein, partial [Kitasatospora sp. NPDC002227]|uniref:carboxylesterase/lipase family protein n=1 Tax=Kitasatospora sp. NPDC002227 TaxID=3154773 RepID=UPI0033313AC9